MTIYNCYVSAEASDEAEARAFIGREWPETTIYELSSMRSIDDDVALFAFKAYAEPADAEAEFPKTTYATEIFSGVRHLPLYALNH